MTFIEQFRNDVIEGLSKPLKKLSSKYFYDDTGDKIFQEIMSLKEYYLPTAELDVLKNRTHDILSDFDYDTFDIIELGAGDGSKTVYFIEQLARLNKNITFRPLDISASVLKTNVQLMKSRLPELKVEPIAGDYFNTLSEIKGDVPKLILFMGSNIGNYENEAAVDFLKKVKSHMNYGDALLVGIDLKKNPKTILAAYNDEKGVTKRFNLNLLSRINRELNGNFVVKDFDHYPTYNPLSGVTSSFIVSLKSQEVEIGDDVFSFKNGEVIHVEVSQKYDLDQVDKIRKNVGFDSVEHYLDRNKYFSVSLFR